MTEHAPVHHPLFARFYERFGAAAEQQGAGAHRDELLAGLSGRVVEVGAGSGLTFSHYPAEVSSVVAIEPEPRLRAAAERAAAGAPVPVVVRDGVAEALPVADGAFDAGVVSLVLCSVRDQDVALAELHRAIRPGGELRFYEHVVSQHAGARRVQRALDRTVWPRGAGNCHLTRDTAAAIERAGFAILALRRFAFPPRGPRLPHVLGIARPD